jgi:hypothetical protein
VFVSDAMIADIKEHIDEISKIGGAAGISLGTRLNDALASGALQVLPHEFYTTAHASWEMPADLRELYSGSHLVIVKGDGTSCLNAMFPFIYLSFTICAAHTECVSGC